MASIELTTWNTEEKIGYWLVITNYYNYYYYWLVSGNFWSGLNGQIGKFEVNRVLLRLWLLKWIIFKELILPRRLVVIERKIDERGERTNVVKL